MKRITKFGALGFAAGLLNGIFGAGGGLLAAPMLQAQGIEPKRAHATSIALMLPLSAASAALYLGRGVALDGERLWAVLPLGLLGAAAGALLLKKLGSGFLKRLFGAVMIVSAIRIFFG